MADQLTSAWRAIAKVREAQSRAQQPSAAAQSRLGGARIKRRTRERWKLPWLPQDRAKYGDDIRCAVVAQSDHRGRRKLPVGRIDNRAAGGKWNPVRGGDPGRNVRFGVDGDRRGSDVKPTDRAGASLSVAPGAHHRRRAPIQR